MLRKEKKLSEVEARLSIGLGISHPQLLDADIETGMADITNHA